MMEEMRGERDRETKTTPRVLEQLGEERGHLLGWRNNDT